MTWTLDSTVITFDSTLATLDGNTGNAVPSVTTNPSNVSVIAPATGTFTIVASGSPTPTVQWQSSPDSTIWTSIAGATGLSYTTPASTAGLTYYRAVLTNSAGTAASSAATFTVAAATSAPTVTANPVNTTVTAPNLATFSASANGAPTPTIQWQSSPDGTTWTNISGATSSLYTTGSTVAGTSYYRAVFTNSVSSVNTTAATLLVNAATGGGATGSAPIVSVQPKSVTVLAGQTAAFFVTVSNSVTSYQWFVNGMPISGATSASYTTGATSSGLNGNAYVVLMTNGVGPTISQAAYLTVVVASTPLVNLIWDGQLPGIKMDITRTYMWGNNIQTAVSGKENRIQLMQYPRVQFEMSYELLRDNLYQSELRTLAGIFNACSGNFGTFLFADQTFNNVTFQQIGIGNGSQVAYQLTANFQNNGQTGAAELIQNFNGAPIVYVNGASVAYTLGPTGVVTLASPAATGAVISWSGNFYYRVRFVMDNMPLSRFMRSWWQSGKIQLLSVKL